METDREAKRRRQQLGRRGRRKTVEERQIGEQGEGNKNNEGEEEGSDGEKRAAWRTKRGQAGHLFLLSTVPFPIFYTYVPSIAHAFLPRSLSFISPLYLSIFPLALLPFFSMFVLLLDPALAFLVSSP